MPKKNKPRYNNILLFGSQQEVVATQSKYFIENTRKLVIFYISPRLSNESNKIRLYLNGKLRKEVGVTISSNIVLCYFYIYFYYIKALFTFFEKGESVIVISYHPICFFLRNFWNLFRKYKIVYWVGDYFPGTTLYNKFYQGISQYYHNRNPYNAYLSDRLNKKMNGKVIDNRYVKTIAWGMEDKRGSQEPTLSVRIGFVGLIKPSQGIGQLLKLIKSNKNYTLQLLGFAPDNLAKKFSGYIKKQKLEKRIFFPNRSYYGEELKNELHKCDIGIALYDTNKTAGSYYADPAKIKTYIQYGLPVITTDIAEVSIYIRKFNAGIVVKRSSSEIQKAIESIRKDYKKYRNGVKSFIKFFEYEKYYNKQFQFLEDMDKYEI